MKNPDLTITPQKYIHFLIFMVAVFSLQCRYSFTGVSVDNALDTFSVELFQNTAQIVVPGLNAQFTEQLRNRFATQTSMRLVQYNGNIQFSGQITRYVVSTAGVQQNSQVSQNMLTIAVWVRCNYPDDEKKNWEQEFSLSTNFDASRSLTQVQSTLNQELTEQLTQNIFNKTFSNW